MVASGVKVLMADPTGWVRFGMNGKVMYFLWLLIGELSAACVGFVSCMLECWLHFDSVAFSAMISAIRLSG